MLFIKLNLEIFLSTTASIPSEFMQNLIEIVEG